MKIIIKVKPGNTKYTIDTKNCSYPYAFREAIKKALSLEGHCDGSINEIFGIMPDAQVEKESDEQ